MKQKIRRVYLALTIVSVILTVYFTIITLDNQFIGVDVYNNKGEVEIIEVEKGGYGEILALDVGDIILEVNNREPLEHTPIKNGRFEQIDSFVVQKLDGTIEYHRVEKVFDIQIVYQFIIPFALYILSLYCSYYIYRSEAYNTHKSPLLLIAFLFTIALAYLSAGASTRGDLFSRFFNILLFISTPAVYLHYIYTYFKEIGEAWFNKKIIYFLYSLSLVNIIVEVMAAFTSRQWVQLTIIVNLSTFLFSFVVTYTLIGLGLKRISYKTQKYMIRVILISSIMAFSPFVFLYIIPLVFFNVMIFNTGFLVAFLLLIPFSLVYQFLATKVYDIEFLLGRFRYYSLLSIIPATVAVLLVLINREGIDPRTYIIRVFVSLLVLFFFTFLWKEILDHKFKLQRFSEKYNYRDGILKFTKQISNANTLHEVVEELKSTILDVLLVSEVHFVHVEQFSHLIKIKSDHKHVEEYRKAIEESSKGEIGTVIELHNGFVINVGESNEGNYLLLCLSKISTPRLTIDEKNWLNAVAYYTNITISNFLKIEALMDHLNNLKQEGKSPVWYNRVLYGLEEKQRSILAKDLHDSVLQDLLSIKRKCELVIENTNENHVSREILEIHDSLDTAIQTTRETCNELRPAVLYDVGLERAVAKLVEHFEKNNRINVSVNMSRLKTPEDIDVQINLYRIVQELLNNAQKHSRAKKILLMIISIKDKIVLHYEDDGVGSNPDEVFNKAKSMGLSGIKERVRTLNGNLDIQTSVGQGFKVIIEI